MQNLGGQTKSIMVFSEVAYCALASQELFYGSYEQSLFLPYNSRLRRSIHSTGENNFGAHYFACSYSEMERAEEGLQK